MRADATTSSLQAPLRLLLVAGVFSLGAYLQARGVLPGIARHWSDIVYLTRQHIGLVALSDSTFAIESAPAARLEFRESGDSVTLTVTQADGERTEIPREAVEGDAVPRVRAAVDSLAAAGEFSGVVVLARRTSRVSPGDGAYLIAQPLPDPTPQS